ncbi:unnamed protein product [Symbiodinium sp. CCMP2592]|nr:unnamed protein product [Symbiodinium sp. CCMP2592]
MPFRCMRAGCWEQVATEEEDASGQEELEKQVRSLLPEGYDAGEVVHVSKAVGPSIPDLWLTNVYILGCTALFFVAVCSTRSCKEGSSYPSVPLWVWCFFLLPLPLQLVTERKAVRLVLRTFVMDLLKYKGGTFKVMGVAVSTRIWHSYSIVMLLLGLLDIYSDTAFAGILSFGGTDMCSAGQTASLWNYWWKHGVMGYLPVPVPALDMVILFSWSLMLLQQLVPVVSMIRKEQVTYEHGDEGKAISAVTGEQLFNDDVFFELSEAACFHSIVHISTDHATCQMERLVREKRHWRIMGYGNTLCSRLMKRFLLSYVLENCVQLNLQAYTLAINQYQAKHLAVLPRFSLVIGMVMAAIKAAEIVGFLRNLIPFVTDVAKEAENLEPPKEEQRKKFQSGLALFRRVEIYSVLALLLMVSSLLTACFTLLGVQLCPEGVITLKGCLEVPGDLLP